MNNTRYDLALEAREVWQERAENTTELSGVLARDIKVDGFSVSRVKILDEKGEKALNKPCGNYITIELCGISRHDTASFERAVNVISKELSSLIPKGDGCVLIVGLGNEGITPDAVGGETVSHVVVTRHLVQQLPSLFGKMRKVAAVAPGVLGMTGIESREIISGAISHINPDFVIVVDALASMRLQRVCKTVQITDTGIVPGSGVGNSRSAITKATLGVPVIAIGVPTVVDIASIIEGFAEDSGTRISKAALSEYTEKLLLTPKDIDVHIKEVGRLLGYAINSAVHEGLTIEEMDEFLS